MNSYVDIQFSNTCIASFGRENQQKLFFNETCLNDRALMAMLGNIVGVLPPHVRPDAEDYIIFNDKTAKPNATFGRDFPDYILNYPNSYIYNISYDYSSVLHPNSYIDSANGNVTLATKDTKYQGLLGRYSSLSHRDLLYVNTHFDCRGKVEVTSLNSAYTSSTYKATENLKSNVTASNNNL
ncbi:hypothetical protein SK128_020734 [Halocaridina rubra]|uniref:Peptidase M12A domain-containing protein n=1 Tax=Halocaridina rubra TaxID=373956 RepID=A0AAN8X5P6_HALRR